MDVAIRPATPRDKRGVFAVIRTIWGGNDYLLQTFDEWVRLRGDRLYVAELDGRVVGVARLAWFSATEAWLETLRVHPRFRARGVGRALMRHRIELATAAGARRIAFSTESGNLPQLRSAKQLGFRKVATLRWMVARARTGDEPRLARPSEVGTLWRVARLASRTEPVLVHRDRGWRWQRVRRDQIATAVRARRCYVSEGAHGIRAFAIVEPDPMNDELIVRVIVGDAWGTGALLQRLRTVALRFTLARVSAFRPEARLATTFARAGYRAPWPFSAAYFEKTLRR